MRRVYFALCVSVLWLLLFQDVLRVSVVSTAAASSAGDGGGEGLLKYLAECMEKNSTDPASKKKKNKQQKQQQQQQRKRKERPFFLYFGDGAVESFNAIDGTDAASIRDLAACVKQAQAADSRFATFAASAARSVLPLYEGARNGSDASADGQVEVQLLTGLFQQVLPDLHSHLLQTMQTAVQKAEWGPHSPARQQQPQRSAVEDVSLLGVRAVYFMTQRGAVELDAYREALRARADALDSTRNSFVIFPDERAKKEHQQKILEKLRAEDPDTDEALMPYLKGQREISGTAYTAVLLLSDRSDFAGGDVLARTARCDTLEAHLAAAVHHGVQQKPAGSEGEGDGEDDDDSGGSSGDTIMESDEEASDRDDYEQEMKKFQDGLYYQIVRYTPERHSLLLVNGAYGFGSQPVRAGTRQALVIELWPFQDAHQRHSTSPEQRHLAVERPELQDAVHLPLDKLQHWAHRHEL